MLRGQEHVVRKVQFAAEVEFVVADVEFVVAFGGASCVVLKCRRSLLLLHRGHLLEAISKQPHSSLRRSSLDRLIRLRHLLVYGLNEKVRQDRSLAD